MLDKTIKNFLVLSTRESIKTLVEGALQELKYTEKKEYFSDLASFVAALSADGRKAIVVDAAFSWPFSLQGGLFALREATFGNETFSVLCAGQIEKSVMAAAIEHNVSKVLLEKQTSGSMFAFQLQALSDALVNPKPFQKMLLLLERAIKKNDAVETEKFANQVFQYFPEQPRGRLEYAEQCVRTEKHDQASELSLGLLKEQPLFLGAVNTLGKLALIQGKIREGIKLLTDAEMLSPGSPVRLTLLGELHFKSGNTTQSEALFNSALKCLPSHRPASIGLAKVQMAVDPSLKVVKIHHSILGDEDTARALNLAAVELARKGDIIKSIELYTICIEIIANPIKKNRVHFNMALALIRSGQTDKAEKALTEILSVEPGFEKAKEMLKKIAS